MNKQVVLGMLIGFAFTLLGFIVILLVFSSQVSVTEVIEAAIKEGYLGKLISFSSIINIGPFFYFIRKRKDDRAKGVIFATILIALIMIVFKFI